MSASSQKVFTTGCKTSKPMKNTSTSVNHAKTSNSNEKKQVKKQYSMECIATEKQCEALAEEIHLEGEGCITDCESEYDNRNLCVSCGVEIGDDNPRQYCMKTYCPRE